MELEEVIERLEKLLKLRLNKANEIKYDNCIIATEDLQIILKYIKEESISKAILEEKLKIEKETRENIQKHYDEDRMKAVNERILIIEEILNKGE